MNEIPYVVLVEDDAVIAELIVYNLTNNVSIEGRDF